ncbi:polyhydroxyalkanoate synthesis repressor PhaR [Methylobacterium sp. AMS5]|uniref:polyhydroxyalkanoate synthesis repressor PhaR n=1 Tax=Methylobacterium sp. AMS5 TaxID=925818 RepID=UPI00074F9E94|nr:polyhydroxyalkanoate synthesis repressor PhaR [Methylobacterium sp. AMS5]AMB46639.1 polyhydroxyalkanoate synthesis repressor PhaR [Methylobacterium sp. AMS5]
MAENGRAHQTVIKKYANRRLYHTGTSTYVTLEDLATMVQNGEDFIVYDARSGDDITRSVLTQIIFEQENKAGDDNLLPVAFLRQLIRFYGDSMRTMVPSFLEFSMANFAKDQDGLREKMAQSFGPSAFQQALQEQVRANMTFFGDAMKMFTGGFGPGGPPPGTMPTTPSAPAPAPAVSGPTDLDELKKQMAEMQARLESLARK